MKYQRIKGLILFEETSERFVVMVPIGLVFSIYDSTEVEQYKKK
jgi:hypothetical protein